MPKQPVKIEPNSGPSLTGIVICCSPGGHFETYEGEQHIFLTTFNPLRHHFKHALHYLFIDTPLIHRPLPTYMDINENFEDYDRRPTFPELFVTKQVVAQLSLSLL